jgi:hypothetical protein
MLNGQLSSCEIGNSSKHETLLLEKTTPAEGKKCGTIGYGCIGQAHPVDTAWPLSYSALPHWESWPMIIILEVTHYSIAF